MRIHTIAPSLLVLAAAPLVTAAEQHVAPVFGPSTDAFHFPLSAPAKVNSAPEPPIQISLGRSTFAEELFFYSTSYGTFKQFGADGASMNRGIAVIGTGGVQGAWFFKSGNEDWVEMPPVNDVDSALLLALSPGYSGANYLGFRPAPNAVVGSDPGFAELIFRAVDDIAGADAADDRSDSMGQPYDSRTGISGGSPSYFSAETRTIRVSVTALNDAPVWNSTQKSIALSAPFFPTGGGQPRTVAINTGVVALANATDPDGSNASALGVLLRLGEPEADFYTWERIAANGAVTPFTRSELGGRGLLLDPSDQLRITVKPHADLNLGLQSGIASLHLWDGSEGTAGDYLDTARVGGSSSLSSASASIDLQLLENNSPVFDPEPSELLVFNPGQDVVRVPYSVTDPDGRIIGFGREIGEGSSVDSTQVVILESGYVSDSITAAWSVTGLNGSIGSTATGSLTLTGLPSASGTAATFALSAMDDLRQINQKVFTLYGNSAPVWDATSLSAASTYSVNEDGSLPDIFFTVSDPDLVSPSWGFVDSLSLDVEGSLSISLPTAQRGTVSIEIQAPPPLTDSILLNGDNPDDPYREFGIPVKVSYVAPANFSGGDSVEIPIFDSKGLGPETPLKLVVQVNPVNDPPVISGVDSNGFSSQSLDVVQGGVGSLTLTASDVDAGDILTWAQVGSSTLGEVTLSGNAGSASTITFTAGQVTGSEELEFTVADSAGASQNVKVRVTVSAAANQSPVIITPVAGTDLGRILGGSSHSLAVHASDPDIGDTLTWSIATQPTKGSLTPISGNGSSVSFRYTAELLASGTDSFELQVADGRGGSARVVLNASVIPNTPPKMSTPIGVSETRDGTVVAVAVRGQPFRTLIGARDLETPGAVAVTISGTLPAGLVFNATGNAGVLDGMPSVAGSFNFSIALDDGVNQVITPVQLTVIEAISAAVTAPSIPVSTPDRTVYGSFLPGSAQNFSALSTALTGRLPSQSRAFWWNTMSQEYVELPTLPAAGTEAWHAVWLASTTPITLPSAIAAVAMPYAMELAPGWTFFGVPPVTDGTTVHTTHAWATFQLQSDTGVPLSPTQRANALGIADAEGPFAWDGETYSRTTSLVTGAGFWLKNTSDGPLRLVRTATATMSSLGLRSASVRADEQPPAPPGGKAAQATDASGGCGAGSGIGLFGVSMAFLFTCLRRRG